MSEKVVLEDGGSVNVHARIKDMCKAARNRLGYTNQDICNKISERFGIEDFSVNTVNNFFSERSKATTIYTTGYICAVLGISIDAVFGIENENSAPEEAELLNQLASLNAEIQSRDQKIEYLENTIKEKDTRLEQAHIALAHYRRESEASRRNIQPWVFLVTFILLTLAIAFICIYILKFDVNNPNYGLFRQGLSSSVSDKAAPLFRIL